MFTATDLGGYWSGTGLEDDELLKRLQNRNKELKDGIGGCGHFIAVMEPGSQEKSIAQFKRVCTLVSESPPFMGAHGVLIQVFTFKIGK